MMIKTSSKLFSKEYLSVNYYRLNVDGDEIFQRQALATKLSRIFRIIIQGDLFHAAN